MDELRLLRLIWNAGAVSLIVGVGGGLLLGWILSRGGNGWLTPVPWLIYLAALAVFAVALSLLWPTPRVGGSDRSADTSAASSNATGSRG